MRKSDLIEGDPMVVDRHHRHEPGVIRFRGYPIEQLIGALRFPQMIWLMLRGELPSPAQAACSRRRWSRPSTTARRRRRSRSRAWR